MSTADSTGLDDDVYRTTFDPETDCPCLSVVEAIETAIGSGSSESVLADSIDPDTLRQLYRKGGADSWMLTFDHGGAEITLWASGRIHVETTATAPSHSSEADSQPPGRPSQPSGGPSHPAGPTL